MRVSSDYEGLLKTLNRHKARYLIVGAYAVIYYTEPRFTKDMDIWVEPIPENAQKVYKALKEFGAPLKGINPKDFTNKKMVYQIGVAPIRVDVIMDIPGIEFNRAWRNRSITNFGGIKVNIIGMRELIGSKRKLKRQTDLADVESLQESLRLKKGSAGTSSTHKGLSSYGP